MRQTTFTKSQISRFANIFDNAGQVIFASAVIPLFLGIIDLVFIQVILWILAMIVCWWISLRLERLAT